MTDVSARVTGNQEWAMITLYILEALPDQFIRATKRDTLQLITVYTRATNMRVSMLFNDYEDKYWYQYIKTFAKRRSNKSREKCHKLNINKVLILYAPFAFFNKIINDIKDKLELI